MVMQCLSFFNKVNKYTSNSSKWHVLKVGLIYPKELRDYPFAPDKLEIKREILSHYQLIITDFYNIPIGNVKRLVPNLLIKKIMCFIM